MDERWPVIRSAIALCGLLFLFAYPTSLWAQGRDDVRVADINAFRELEAPEPVGIRAVYLLKAEAKRNAEIKVWEIYANARQDWILDHEIPLPETEGTVAPRFEEELNARTKLAEALNEDRRRVGKTHRNYSDDMQKVIDAGYFKEYVFDTHREDGWDASKLDLKLDEYKAWATENIPDHEPLTYAYRVARALNRTKAVMIIIDSELQTPSEGAFWLRYSVARFDYRNDQQLPYDLLIGEEAIPSFDEEVAARTALLKDFDDIQDSLCVATRTATEEMAKAEAKGYMREYVWSYLHQDGWEQPEDLKLEEFKTWAENEIPTHKAPTHAILIGR